MKTIKALIIVALCGLLPGCTLMKDYDIDTSPDGVRDRTIVEHFEEYDYNQNCLLFCKAARWSGLLDELEAGGRTVVVPNDNAMKAFMTELGVTQIEEIHPNLLRALMRYLIFPGDYRALNMTPVEMDGNTIKNPEEVTWVESLAGYPIGIARGPSSRNKYRMGIITPGTTTVITVAQQDYVFKNQMVAQVVPTFPHLQGHAHRVGIGSAGLRDTGRQLLG